MTKRGLADTSVFIAREARRRIDVEAMPDRLAVSVVTVGELRAGVLAATDAATRDRRLDTLTAALSLDTPAEDDAKACDDIIGDMAIFADGFESGDTSAWNPGG